MKLLKRNLQPFAYRPLTGQSEHSTPSGLATGERKPTYGEPVTYYGNIRAATGFASNEWFGKNVIYSHILLMDDVDVPIDEYGLIDYKGETYEIRQKSPSLNVVAFALRRLTANKR